MLSDRFIHMRTTISGLPVLFLHAFPVNSRMWLPQIDALHTHGYSSIAIDYPGFGLSPPPTGSMTIDDYARLAIQTADEFGIRKAVVVGLSMGGYVAMALLRQAPAFVHALVLAATRAGADSPEGLERRRKLIKAVREAGSPEPVMEGHLSKFFTESTRKSRPDLIDLARSMMAEAHPEGIIRALEAMAGRPDSYDVLSRFTGPALVISGSDDELSPPEEGRKMAEALPQGSLSVIEQSAHLINLEQTDAFNRVLLDFLATLS